MAQEAKAVVLTRLELDQTALVVLEQFLQAVMQMVLAVVLVEQQALMEIFQVLLYKLKECLALVLAAAMVMPLEAEQQEGQALLAALGLLLAQINIPLMQQKIQMSKSSQPLVLVLGLFHLV
jgi:hypothetical protein